MSTKHHYVGILIFTLAMSFSSSLSARAMYDIRDYKDPGNKERLEDPPPPHCIAVHRVGNISLNISNNGTFGNGFAAAAPVDCFTKRGVSFGCEVPKNGGVEYLFAGAFWIGAIVGRDTLVSVGADGWQFTREMFPDKEMIKRSIIDPTDNDLFEDAVSEEDYISQYTDTVTRGLLRDNRDNRDHKPIGIEVTQRSYAWSYEYAEDFVLFDYGIKNIGLGTIRDVYMGVYVDADVGSDPQMAFTDDISGFTPAFIDTHLSCQFVDVANIAWISDNDGDLTGAIQPAPHVTGTRIVRTPAESLEVSFNWWISNGNAAQDFGPREKEFQGRLKEKHRDFGHGGLGTPEGDRNKYYIMRNQEFDYDQVFAASIGENDPLWQPPDQRFADVISQGFDTRYLLSFGPFDIDPGEELPISFAYVAGQNLHVDAGNFRSNMPGDPNGFYLGLEFKDLWVNARWAGWIYDNPGVDTDSNGFAGEMRFCPLDSVIASIDTNGTIDTTWDYTRIDTSFATGDGVPDFRGAAPPPAPALFIEPTVGEIHVRFNGYRSETTKDPFSRLVDFEGYRIYVARDDRSTSYSRVVSFDNENYNKWIFNRNSVPPSYELRNIPFTYQELFDLYAFGNTDFDPLRYTLSRPFRFPFTHPSYADSQFYFERQGFNASSLTDPSGIRKIYPNQPFPSSLVLDSLPDAEKTAEGFPKYFEYEYTIDNLLPTVPYWVSVTAFDFGSPSSGLPSLETNVTLNTDNAYPLETPSAVDSLDLEVFIYPNPYRSDANYRQRGFEGVDTLGNRLSSTEAPDSRVRRINFANLPPKCIISIFSIDGDLVREILHDMNPLDPNASHDAWNLITRNTQAAVSGLYYWIVENSDTGEVQMGKLVIIM